jgi:serine/threonine protein phosphatase PrpC
MKRCGICGAKYSAEDTFCEIDGTRLEAEAPGAAAEPSPATAASWSRPGSGEAGDLPSCPSCNQGKIEADGFCSVCGMKLETPAQTVRSFPPSGGKLAGGVVIATPSATESMVRMADGTTALVVLGEMNALEREASVLERAGHAAFPRVVAVGVDDTYGAYLAIATKDGAKPLGEAAPSLAVREMIGLAREVVLAAGNIERQGMVWEPGKADVRVHGPNLVLSRLRTPRRLAAGERLDARAVLEAIGPCFVPAPALGAPPRALRLLLPHVVVPGDAGSTVEDVLAELDAVEREIEPPPRREGRVDGVCDPGLRRPHNEDAFAAATGLQDGEPWTVLVVCDGVSSSTHAEQASTIASKTACDALAHFARIGDVGHEAAAGAVGAAIRAAHVAVCAQGIDAEGNNPPGTTIVVGLVWRRRLAVGWVGDSRAYWVSEHGSELLTRDHSWANEAVARGEVTEEQAKRSPLAHALTRCLGPLEQADPDNPSAVTRIAEVEPEVRTRDLPGPGWIVLCTDGFWNYFPEASRVAELVHEAGPGASSGLIARRLVARAVVAGGQDNTTVLVHEHTP